MLKKYVTISRSIDETGRLKSTKTGCIRSVPLSEELAREISAAKARRIAETGKEDVSDEFVFVNAAGKPLDSTNFRNRVFNRCLEIAGLRKIHFHCLRHTFSSLLLQRGIPIARVSKWLGHRSIQVTVNVYGHLEPSTNGSAINLLPSAEAKTADVVYRKNQA